MISNMLQGADTGDEIERAFNCGSQNIVTHNVIMSIHHPFGPVVLYIVNGCHERTKCSNELRQRRLASPHVEHRLRAHLRQILKEKPVLDRPLIETLELLREEFSTTDLSAIVIADLLNESL